MCSGKSYLIDRYFKQYKIFDIFTFQQDKKLSQKVYEEAKQKGFVFKRAKENKLEIPEAACMYSVIEACNDFPDDPIILEHLLSNKIRRQEYVKLLKEKTGRNIECYFLKPSQEILEKNISDRVDNWEKEGKLYPWETPSQLKVDTLKYCVEWYKIAEVPTCDDGFSKVQILETIGDLNI